MSISPHNPTRVLILEDEPRLAAEFQKVLEGGGYEVVGPAHSCEAALELLWSKDVDAAILDLIVGDGSCEVVANELSLSGIPWAFASDLEAHELRDRFPHVPIIEKPSFPDSVAKVVKSLLTSGEA